MAASDTRRSFLERSLLLGVALWPLEGQTRSRVLIEAGPAGALAPKELLRGLLSLRLPSEARLAAGETPRPGDRRIVLRDGVVVSQ